MPRQYQRIRTAIPTFWDAELTRLFQLWCQDMNYGLRPYTKATANTFERRFILYTRRQFENQMMTLTVNKAFDPIEIYGILLRFPVEAFSNRHNMLYTIISFAKFLITLDRLPAGLIDQLRKYRPKRVIPPRKTVLREVKEIEALRKATRTKLYRTPFSRLLDQTLTELLMQSGLRVSEASNLNLEHVDMEKRVITVYLGKGRKTRKVGITQELYPYLIEYLKVREQQDIQDSNAFLINPKGRRLTSPNITRRMQKLSIACGIPITSHGLRRTFATIHANNGRPLNMIQLALGHNNLSTTQAYLMTDERQVIEAMKGW